MKWKDYRIFSGGYYSVGAGLEDFCDTVFEYDYNQDAFIELEPMIEERENQGISVVKYSDFSQWCELK